MAIVKRIHFGWFVRQKRHEAKKKVRAFANLAGITEKRLIDIEKMETPKVNESTFYGIADALGMSAEQLTKAWQSTRVAPPSVRPAGHKHNNTRIIRVAADLYDALGRMAARETKTIEELLQSFVAGAIDENLTVISPPKEPALQTAAPETRGRDIVRASSRNP